MIVDRLLCTGSADFGKGPTHEIDNSGPPEAGGEALIRILLAIRTVNAPVT